MIVGFIRRKTSSRATKEVVESRDHPLPEQTWHKKTKRVVTISSDLSHHRSAMKSDSLSQQLPCQWRLLGGAHPLSRHKVVLVYLVAVARNKLWPSLGCYDGLGYIFAIFGLELQRLLTDLLFTHNWSGGVDSYLLS